MSFDLPYDEDLSDYEMAGGAKVRRSTRAPSKWNLYVKAHYNDADIQALNYTKRLAALAVKARAQGGVIGVGVKRVRSDCNKGGVQACTLSPFCSLTSPKALKKNGQPRAPYCRTAAAGTRMRQGFADLPREY